MEYYIEFFPDAEKWHLYITAIQPNGAIFARFEYVEGDKKATVHSQEQVKLMTIPILMTRKLWNTAAAKYYQVTIKR